MTTRLIVPLVAAAALVVVGPAQAAKVQRLTYKKAVAYWKAEARAHAMQVRCTPYTTAYIVDALGCTFGTVNRVQIISGNKCKLTISVFEKTHSVKGGNELTGYIATVNVASCQAGWQKTLPSPWNLPPE